MTTKTRKWNLLVGMAGFTPQAETDNHHTPPLNLSVRAHFRLLTTTIATIFLASAIWSAPMTVLFAGDSITTGIKGVSSQGERLYSIGGFRVHVSTGLTARGIQHTLIGPQSENAFAPWDRHAGYPGFGWVGRIENGVRKSWGLNDFADAWLPWGGQPVDWIVLLCGTNDINAAPNADFHGVSTLQARATLTIQNAHARRPDAKFLLLSIPPRRDWDAVRSPWIQQYAMELPRFAARLRAEGLPVWPCGIYHKLGQGHFFDPLHLNELGNETVGGAIVDAMMQIEPPRRLPRLDSAGAQGGNE